MRGGWRSWVGVVGIGVWVAGSSGLVVAQGEPPGEAECIAGASGIGDGYFPTTGNGGYDVRHYDLDLAFDVGTSEITAATATIDAFAIADLCSFNLDFEGLSIDGITVDGARAEGIRRGKELTVMPERPIEAGDAFTVEVRYSGTPVIQVALGDGPPKEQRGTPEDPAVAAGLGGADPDETSALPGGWFVAEDEIFILGEPTGNRTWYPLNEHPADKATYTFHYTVAEPFVVVGNGSKVEEVDNGETTTFVYDSRDPIANYLVTFHAGRLDLETLDGPHGLPITLSFAPGVPEDQRAVYRRLPEMIAWAERLFGPYPFETAGATVTGPAFGVALETQTMPIFGSYPVEDFAGSGLPPEQLAAIQAASIEDLLLHELAHQWFGDSVSVQRWRDIWLNEGFATYAQSLWLEETQGVDARDTMLRRLYGLILDETRLVDPARLADLSAADVLQALQDRGEYLDDASVASFLALLGVTGESALEEISASDGLDALEADGVPPAVFPGLPLLAGDPGRTAIFSYASYDRGALTLHALRLEVGDAVFFEILKAWGERFGNGNAATADLVTLAEEISGEELSPLFDAWLFQLTLPDLEGVSG